MTWRRVITEYGSGNDLPDTTVYVDDLLVATRLDDGKAYDVDPGKHAVKLSHAGKEQIITVVVGAGEKGRTVNATFGAPAASPVAPPLAGAGEMPQAASGTPNSASSPPTTPRNAGGLTPWRCRSSWMRLRPCVALSI